MTDVLMTTRFLPGQLNAALNGVARVFDKGNLPLGVWASELGLLNQLVTLCPLDRIAVTGSDGLRPFDLLAGTTASDCDGLAETEVRLLQRLEPFRMTAELDPASVYELRAYEMAPSAIDTFIGHLSAAIPVRDRYSLIEGWWKPITGKQDQIIHLWKYRDLEHRRVVRQSANDDPDWQAFLKKVVPLLRVMQSTVLNPLRLPVVP